MRKDNDRKDLPAFKNDFYSAEGTCYSSEGTAPSKLGEAGVPFWKVVLPHRVHLVRVEVLPRGECCNWLSPFNVTIGDTECAAGASTSHIKTNLDRQSSTARQFRSFHAKRT